MLRSIFSARAKSVGAISLAGLRGSFVEEQWIANPSRSRIGPVGQPRPGGWSYAEMKSGAALSAGRACVPGALDLIAGVDDRASIAARRTVVLECERVRPGPRQHQRRRENREGSQELLHVIHHLAFTIWLSPSGFHHLAFKLIEFHQENQVINGQKEANVNFRSMRQLCDTVHSRSARIERKKQTNRPLGEVYLGVN